MRIALAQINTTVGDFAGNVARILAAARAAPKDLVLFPELAICGYMPRDLLLEPSFLDACDRALGEIARAPGPPLLLGTVQRAKGPGKPLLNVAVLVRDGKHEVVAEKRLLPTYDVFDVRRYFRPKVLEAVAMLPGQVVYDLGCGDGRFLIAAVKKYNVKDIGVEINPWAYVLSKLKMKLWTTNVSIHFKDFWNADLSGADFVFCYLFPDVMERLREKLSRELKAGAKVISCNFAIPGWRPAEIITASHPVHNDPSFIYTRK